jgi:4'-phosphopantetheinyl transferase
MEKLSENIINIFYADCDRWSSADLDNGLSYLSAAEKEVYHRYRVQFKKAEFCVGRVLLKQILGNYLGIEPLMIHFQKNQFGKLYLDESFQYPQGRRIKFNLAHSAKMVAMAVTLENEIGLDVEKVGRPILDIAKRYFTPGEQEYISGFPPELQNEAAYRIWTRKEAYLKAKGVGLSMPLESFDVTRLAREIYFHSCQPQKGYHLSVAVDAQASLEYTINLREVAGMAELLNITQG